MSGETNDNLIQETPGSTPDFKTELARQLAELMPEVVADGKIDTVKLKELLDEDVADENERFGLFWPGKRRALRAAQEPTTATLRPDKANSKDWDTTQNVFIEGDNLEVLKILQKHYHNKIKLIYIDPPYNTGKDFVYPDNYKEGLETYLEWTRQVNEEGKRVSTNSESEGRYHSNWLNMMYPRLKLARNLLTDDGVIFMSIGEHEVHHARQMFNEVFGEANFINLVGIKTKESSGASGGGEDKKLKKNLEFLLFYARSLDRLQRSDVFQAQFLQALIEEKRAEGKSYEYRQVLVDMGEAKRLGVIKDGAGEEIEVFEQVGYTVKSVEQLAKADGTTVDAAYGVYHSRVFRTTNAQTSIRTRVQEFLGGKEGLFSIKYVPRSGKDKGTLTTKYFSGSQADLLVWLADTSSIDADGQVVKLSKVGTLWDDLSWTGIAKEGGVEFENGKKPVSLIRRLLQIATAHDHSAIVLDFFAGSGTAAHAVFSQNAEDGGSRRFILVQLPEPIKDGKFSTISDLTRERLKRSAASFADGATKLIGGDLDLGFRSFALRDSWLSKWRVSSDTDRNTLEQHLFSLRESASDDATPDDLLIEILLKQGYSLTEKIAESQISDLDVRIVGDNMVFAYLTEAVKPTLEQLRSIVDQDPQRIIILEDAFQGDDELKTNLAQLCKSKGIELWTA